MDLHRGGKLTAFWPGGCHPQLRCNLWISITVYDHWPIQKKDESVKKVFQNMLGYKPLLKHDITIYNFDTWTSISQHVLYIMCKSRSSIIQFCLNSVHTVHCTIKTIPYLQEVNRNGTTLKIMLCYDGCVDYNVLLLNGITLQNKTNKNRKTTMPLQLQYIR